jgi:hypothetical protein
MRLAHRVDPLGRGDEADQAQLARAVGLQPGQRGDRAAAGGQHRVQQEDVRIAHPGRQALVIARRLQRGLVALHAQVTDACAREQAQEAVDHAEPGAQHGHDGDLGLQAAPGRRLQRRVDGVLHRRQIARGLDGEDRRGLAERLAEGPVRGRRVAQDRQAVVEDGVLHDVQALGHDGDPLRSVTGRSVRAVSWGAR